MFCQKCKVAMKEMKRTYHKKRKWICPVCGRSRMEGGKKKRKERSSKASNA